MKLFFFSALCLVSLHVLAMEQTPLEFYPSPLSQSSVKTISPKDQENILLQIQQASQHANGTQEERRAALQKGFKTSGIKKAKLTDLSCNDSDCNLQITISSTKNEVVAANVFKLHQWIAKSSPCAFTVEATPHDESTSVMASIKCDALVSASKSDLNH